MLARVVGERGAVRYRHAHTALTNTKVAVLLVTPNFIASDFIHAPPIFDLSLLVAPSRASDI